jgi:hypothetical protein
MDPNQAPDLSNRQAKHPGNLPRSQLAPGSPGNDVHSQ